MRSVSAYIKVTCERCGKEEDVKLTPIGAGSETAYSERHVEGELRDMGWDSENDICPNCLQEQKEEEEEC